MLRLLNNAILLLAPRNFIAAAHAPSTLADLRQCDEGRLVVWDGASDATIYRDARINHAFRAWHDSHHVKAVYSFDLAGETLACEAQCAELRAAFPSVPEKALAFIRAEIVGQTEYFAAHGAFPTDQIEFTLATIGGLEP